MCIIQMFFFLFFQLLLISVIEKQRLLTWIRTYRHYLQIYINTNVSISTQMDQDFSETGFSKASPTNG